MYRYHLISVHDTPIFWKRLLDNVAVLGALTKYTRDIRGTNQCMCAKTKHGVNTVFYLLSWLPLVFQLNAATQPRAHTRKHTHTHHTTSSDARQKYSGSNIQNTNVWFSLIRTDDVLRAYLLLIVLKIFFSLSIFFSGFHHEIFILIYITQREMNRLVTVSFSSVLFYQIKTIKK